MASEPSYEAQAWAQQRANAKADPKSGKPADPIDSLKGGELVLQQQTVKSTDDPYSGDDGTVVSQGHRS